MKAVVFSGTSEGKEIAKYLDEKGIDTVVSVATEYGREVMEELPFVSVHTGRLDVNEMTEFIDLCDFVIDATHPYAQNVTENIKKVCAEKEIEYIRLLREDIKYSNGIIVDDIKAAVDILKDTDGNIFVSTGSKELHLYSEIPYYKARITARVLPVDEAVKKCTDMGLENVIYDKGPFSYSDNIEAFKKYNTKWLVTKSSGKNGGFDEKISAAEKLGMKIIIIKRPDEEKGFSISEVKKMIDNKQLLHHKKFPVFMDISGKRVLVVGGGNIAVRRINILIQFGARVKVVANKIDKENINGKFEYIQKSFEFDDIKDEFMVIAATDNREVNHNIYKICNEKGILVSVADCKEECSFYFPGVCLNDKLSVGVISDGTNHSLVRTTAEKIRRIINE